MTTFRDFSISENILKALDAMGFENPTPVQEKVLTQFEEERKDMIAVAQTGTGKTAAFIIPILMSIEANSDRPQAIILSPTRELAIQIEKDIIAISKYMKGVKSLCVYGGTAITNQIKDLKRGVQLVVGTPGRTVDLIKRKKLDLSEVQWLVLDEADEMLSMGFKEDLDFILSGTPEDKTTLLFSATLPKEILKISKKYLSEAVEIRVKGSNEGSKNIEYSYHLVERSNKYEALKRILDLNQDIYGIVFCRTRAETNDIAADLSHDGYNADVLNGDLSQGQRDNVMKRFRKRQIKILVATDVAARGLDVDDLTHVLHYQLPDEREVFVHRSGRTGRAGKSGASIAIISPKDKRKLGGLEKAVGKEIPIAKVPSGDEIFARRLASFVDNFEKLEVPEEPNPLFAEAETRLMKMTKAELIHRIISKELEETMSYYSGSGDINLGARSGDKRDRKDRNSRDRDQKRDRGDRRERGEKRDRGDKRERGSREEGRSGGRKSGMSMSRFFINVGSKHSLKPKELIEMINDKMPKNNVEIGQIEIMTDFSFFEVDSDYSKDIEKSFKDEKYKHNKISVEPAQAKSSGSKSRRRDDRPKSRGPKKDRHRGGGGRKRKRD